MQDELKPKRRTAVARRLFNMGGEYRSRTDDLLHAMQAL